MAKHAGADADKATFVLINIEGNAEAANGFAAKHSLGDTPQLVHLVGQPPPEYGLQYIPHHVVIADDGTVPPPYLCTQAPPTGRGGEWAALAGENEL